MEPLLLGIDVGGSVAKAALFKLDGTEVAVASRPVVTLSPHKGWSERSPEQEWADTAAVVRAVIAEAGTPAASIVAAACTGYGNGLYALDSDGKPVRAAVTSGDLRARSVVEEWRASGIESQAMQWSCQTLWAAQPPVLLRWMRDHEPDHYRRTRRVLQCKDHVRYKLTGVAANEVTDCSGSSLMDVRRRSHSPELLTLFGIDEVSSMLTPALESHETAGCVTRAAAQETGLPARTPVAAGMFDIDACCLGAGVLDAREAVVVAGTWGNCLSVSSEPVCHPAIFMTSCFCLPGQFLLLEGSATSAPNVDWLLRELGVNSFAEAEALAARADPSATPVFLPFLYGSNSSPGAQACFVGITAATTRAELIRSAYEGVCFAQKVHFERLLQFRSRPDAVRFTGGPARSAWWRQIMADSLGVPVIVPAGDELGAKGSAIAAGVAAGCFQNCGEAVQQMTRASATVLPDRSNVEALQSRFDRYRKTALALTPLWSESFQ